MKAYVVTNTPCGVRSVFRIARPPAAWHSECVTAISAVPPVLAELAAQCGVATGYTDAHGVRRDVSEPTLRAVLAAMGVGAAGSKSDDLDNDDDNIASDRAALTEHRLKPWRRVLPPTVVARQGSAISVQTHIPLGAEVSISIHLEDSGSPIALKPDTEPTDHRDVDGHPMVQLPLSIPGDLPTGWHRLVVVVGPVASSSTASDFTTNRGAGPAVSDRTTGPHPGRAVESTLIVAPTSIPIPAGLDQCRAVGLAAQLYQVRSADSWGIGDLADLAELASWGGRDLGADFVLVNPMHAGEPNPPVSPSPYLPTTRRFASPLYLRPELLPEYSDLNAIDRARVDQLAHTAATPVADPAEPSSAVSTSAEPNSADFLDRDTSWAAKLEALRLLYSVPQTPHRAAEFDEFLRSEEPGLRSFATWCALAGEHGPDWTKWPTDLREPESPGVANYASAHPDEIRFHQWLQWITAEQRAHAQQAAVDAGMRLGILHDLAVGVHPTGADAWLLNCSLARGVSVGAPPDIYNQRGQDWSQPPLRPDALAESGYRQFRDIVRAALRDAGGVRIDHILGLFRLWWVPAGRPPTDGTYVTYDHEAMLAVLALEATRARAVVVGEDLGTVAPGVREALSERGILGTSVMWFENDDDNKPLAPEKYRRLCMASLTTHDLAPTAGYADLVHVDIRQELGQLTRNVELERQDAEAEVERFVDALRERGLLEGDSSEDLIVALHTYVAQSPSLLFAVSVADLVGDRRPVNIPGTSDEYPNWSVPLADAYGRPLRLEDVLTAGLPRRVFAGIGEVGG